MKHPTSRSLYAYWNQRRGNRTIPDRADIDPVHIGVALVDMFLIYLNGEHVGFRFAGSGVATIFGRDLTGEDFLGLWRPHDRDTIRDRLKAMEEDGCGFVAGIVANSTDGGSCSLELLVLPLGGATGCDRAIGSLVRIASKDDPDRARLAIGTQSLRSIRSLTGDGGKPLQKADRPAPALPVALPGTPRRYGHLVVLPGGK